MTERSKYRLRGFTLIELIIAIAMFGIVATALTRLMIVQSQFVSEQDAGRFARSASRGALNVFISDLRMVEVSGGMVAAAAQDITVRVPYAFGVICGTSGANTTISLLPTDSVTMANAAFSGFAWRGSNAGYNYVEGGASLPGSSTPGSCTAASLTTLPDGQIVNVQPTINAPAGTPIFLFQRVRYEFKASDVMPGRIGLWRTLVQTGASDEIVAPFDAATRFRFFVLNAGSAQDAVPAAITDIRGLQLVLQGASEQAPQGSAQPETFALTAAVFFKNRAN